MVTLVWGLLVLYVVAASPTRYARQAELDNYDVDLNRHHDFDYYNGVDEPTIGTLDPDEDPSHSAYPEEEEEERHHWIVELGEDKELPVTPLLIPSGSEHSGTLMGPNAEGEEELRLTPIDILQISGSGEMNSGASGDLFRNNASGSGEALGSGASGHILSSGGSGGFGSGVSGTSGSGILLISGGEEELLTFGNPPQEASGDFEESGFFGVSGESGFSGVPEGSGESGVPEVSGELEVSGVPEISGVSGEPEISGVPEMSGETEISGVPEVSGEPEISGVPEVSGEPEISGVPEVSGEPEVPGISGVPEVSGVLEISGVSGEPEISGVAEVSGVPEISGVSGETEISGVPEISGESGETEISGLPEEPEISGVPELSGEPEISGVPELSGEPEISGVPELPVEPEISGVPELSGEPAVSGVPEDPLETGEFGSPEESVVTESPEVTIEVTTEIFFPELEEEEEILLTTPTTPQEGTGGEFGSGDFEIDPYIPGMSTCVLCTCLGGSVYCDDLRLTRVPPLPKETTHFYARYNKITKISKSDFINLNKLKKIDLTNNAISKIDDDAFFGLPALEELILRENSIRQLPALPHSMTLIDACHNQLGSTGIHKEAFKDMPGLLYLYLTDNNIYHIPVPLPDSLRSLHLQNNNIQMMHDDTFCNPHDLNYIRYALEDVRLDGNPINLSRTPQAYICLPRIPVGALI
nr:epiphycan isoform X2 [Misgurnus anguillicaudatus]